MQLLLEQCCCHIPVPGWCVRSPQGWPCLAGARLRPCQLSLSSSTSDVSVFAGFALTACHPASIRLLLTQQRDTRSGTAGEGLLWRTDLRSQNTEGKQRPQFPLCLRFPGSQAGVIAQEHPVPPQPARSGCRGGSPTKQGKGRAVGGRWAKPLPVARARKGAPKRGAGVGRGARGPSLCAPRDSSGCRGDWGHPRGRIAWLSCFGTPSCIRCIQWMPLPLLSTPCPS